MKKGIIGVLGGMGPDATAAFFSMLVRLDKAPTDQEHLHVVVDSDTSIPDRTAHLLSSGPDPLPEMLASARRLLGAGVDVAGMPCMTAHAFLPELRRNTTLRLLSAFEETRAALDGLAHPVRKVGVLGTIGTKRTRLFENSLPGCQILWPDEETHRTKVMEAIYGKKGIKAGNLGRAPHDLLMEAATSLLARGAEVIIGGCTEVPLVLSQRDFNVPFIDPMEYLARALIAAARAIDKE